METEAKLPEVLDEKPSPKKYEPCWWPLESGAKCGKPHLIKELTCSEHSKHLPLWPTSEFNEELADNMIRNAQ